MRIITGTARGAKLRAPKGMTTRPTADRIKESLFNILGRTVEDKKVLDVFAGTGNLGLEALSRGADSAVFIDKATADIIIFNAEHTHLSDRAEVLRGDALHCLSQLELRGCKFDLVFCDPPYRMGLWERVLSKFDNSNLLNNGAVIIVEHGTDENDFPRLNSLVVSRNEKYGRTTQLTFLVKQDGSD